MSGARDFNNIETQAVIKFFFLARQGANEIHAILTETLACFLPGRAKDLPAPLYNYTYYQNTQAYTHPHITKQVKTATSQDTHQMSQKTIKYAQYNFTLTSTVLGSLYANNYTPFSVSWPITASPNFPIFN